MINKILKIGVDDLLFKEGCQVSLQNLNRSPLPGFNPKDIPDNGVANRVDEVENELAL